MTRLAQKDQIPLKFISIILFAYAAITVVTKQNDVHQNILFKKKYTNFIFIATSYFRI